MDRRTDKEILEAMKEAFLNLPVGINNNLGDAFQLGEYDQWENTKAKVRKLKADGHKGNIMIGTKWVPTDKQIQELYEINPDIWIFYGLNGSNESKRFSMDERIDGYLRLCDKFQKVALTLRPIIPGKNDNMDVLRPLIELAGSKRGDKYLHHGGYRDPRIVSDKKYDYSYLIPEIDKICRENGVKSFSKSCCLVAAYDGKPCRTHTPSFPQNLDVLRYFGYVTEVQDGKVVVLRFRDSNVITKADICFVKHIAGTSLVTTNNNDIRKKLQIFGPEGQKLICTSGWFGWSREMPKCEVGCYYCIVNPNMPNYTETGNAGCSPLDLYNYYKDRGYTE